MMMQTRTFDVVDLINLVAADHDWDLCFDSGPGDSRELIYSRTDRSGADLELQIALDFTGRIERADFRREGEVVRHIGVDKWTSAADVHVLTLELFKR
ncbi:hypothetical protein DVS77_18925 [Mycolicibacterium moriokaense]|nr:hypothetical protein DVS77_18925 [Mycolicibacterium moriokaense]